MASSKTLESRRARRVVVEPKADEVFELEASRLQLDEISINELRRAFFREAGEAALRFNVSIDDILDHLRFAFDLSLLRTDALRRVAIERIAQNIEELVIAIACIRGDENAWSECIEPLRPVLIRMCELRVDEADAILHASRFILEVRNRTFGRTGEFDDGIPRLQEFAGIQPLRSYLGGPLFAILQDLIKDGMAVATRPSTSARAATRNLRLAD
ncbi:MAG: hypothetical protein P8J59_03955 [Phycisphaerales bacterium]|jgi:hypothetical protein|nr:hypothetical protein [Phycisphaerales bacterium]